MKVASYFWKIVSCSLFLSAILYSQQSPGELLYNRHCASCHGSNGNGQGPAAFLLYPKPRNFTTGVYKFRSTPTGNPPTDDDLMRTIRQGIPGTSMPAWDVLHEKEIKEIVAYIKSFAKKKFEDEDNEPPIAIPATIPKTKESIEAGKKLYAQMKCGECHGASGKGDGLAAKGLKDDSGIPLRPYDFTRGSGFMKSGPTGNDIFRTMVTGLDGTPMPSYAFLAEQGSEGWNLVHFIQSLITEDATSSVSLKTPSVMAFNGLLDPQQIATETDEFIWKQIPVTSVPLRPLWSRNEWVDTVSVQAIASNTSKTLSFRLEWNDSTKDEEVLNTTRFRDGVAIQSAVEGNPDDYLGIPFLGMGDWNGSVRLWHWKADWQVDIEQGFRDPVTHYGKTMDWVPEDSTRILALTGASAGNSMSNRKRKSSVEALIAKGFGTLTTLPENQQTAIGKSVWKNGRWTVLIQIKNFPGMDRLLKNQAVPIAFAIWDGSAGDRNGQKSVSQWISISLK